MMTRRTLLKSVAPALAGAALSSTDSAMATKARRLRDQWVVANDRRNQQHEHINRISASGATWEQVRAAEDEAGDRLVVMMGIEKRIFALAERAGIPKPRSDGEEATAVIIDGWVFVTTSENLRDYVVPPSRVLMIC